MHQSDRDQIFHTGGVWEEDSKKESSVSSLILEHGPLTIPSLLPSGSLLPLAFPNYSGHTASNPLLLQYSGFFQAQQSILPCPKSKELKWLEEFCCISLTLAELGHLRVYLCPADQSMLQVMGRGRSWVSDFICLVPMASQGKSLMDGKVCTSPIRICHARLRRPGDARTLHSSARAVGLWPYHKRGEGNFSGSIFPCYSQATVKLPHPPISCGEFEAHRPYFTPQHCHLIIWDLGGERERWCYMPQGCGKGSRRPVKKSQSWCLQRLPKSNLKILIAHWRVMKPSRSAVLENLEGWWWEADSTLSFICRKIKMEGGRITISLVVPYALKLV